MSIKSLSLVIVQFLCFAFFLFGHKIIATYPWVVIQLSGFIISIWGVYSMKIGNFNIQPEVKKTAVLITRGPFKIIRNPMYAGLILFFGSSVISSFSFTRLFVFLILLSVLLEKIKMEEIFLSKTFGKAYQIQKKKTFKLIPYLY